MLLFPLKRKKKEKKTEVGSIWLENDYQMTFKCHPGIRSGRNMKFMEI